MSTEDTFRIGDAVYAPPPTAHGTIAETKLDDDGIPLYLVVPDWVAHAHHLGEDLAYRDANSDWYPAEDLEHSGTRRPQT